MKTRLTVVCLALTQLAWTQYFTSNGRPVRWYQTEVDIRVDENGTADVPGDGEFDAVRESLKTWNDVACPHPVLVDGGTTSGEVPGESGGNLVIWEDASQWTHVDRPKVIALTTLYFNDSNGVVVKFDMEFADHKFQFTTTDDPAESHTDVQNTVTHEMGHVLGLDHSQIVESTMFFKTDNDDPFQMRTLHDDDVEGLCAVYDSGLVLPDGQSIPDGGSWDPSGPPGGSGSCSIATGVGGATNPGVAGWMLLAAVALLLLVRTAHRMRALFRLTWLALIPLVLVSPWAFADQALDIEIRAKVLEGTGKPTIIIRTRTLVRGLSVRLLEKGRVVRKYRAIDLGPGQSREFPIEQPAGAREYQAEIRHRALEQPETITFTAVVARPMELGISRDTVDLAEGVIAFTASEPVARVDLKILGESGTLLLDEEFPVTSRANALTMVRFEPPAEVVTLVKLTAYDPWDFYNGVEIAPFFVEIPHEEVTFEFGKARIRPTEEPKLRHTMQNVQDALRRLANEFTARLYVAGYTDSVGTREYNQDLSERRASEIARWFKSHGIAVGVCYQGFGEDAPAVSTPDETPEPRNRRTVHVLANQHPPRSKTFPRRSWKCH